MIAVGMFLCLLAILIVTVCMLTNINMGTLPGYLIIIGGTMIFLGNTIGILIFIAVVATCLLIKV